MTVDLSPSHRLTVEREINHPGQRINNNNNNFIHSATSVRGVRINLGGGGGDQFSSKSRFLSGGGGAARARQSSDGEKDISSCGDRTVKISRMHTDRYSSNNNITRA